MKLQMNIFGFERVDYTYNNIEMIVALWDSESDGAIDMILIFFYT